MFVVTPYDTSVNLDHYPAVALILNDEKEKGWHNICVVSLNGNRTILAAWEPTDEGEDKAVAAYADLNNALEDGKRVFDIRSYTD